MVDFISNWAEQVVLAIIIATILEMLLPNSKNKKYIKMIIGIYILFCILSPFVKNTKSFSTDEIDLSKYKIEKKEEVNQESMDKRLEELYIEELEQDVRKKVEESGYKVNKCKVDAILNKNDKNAGINKIVLEISKNKNINVSDIENININVDINNKQENEEKNISKDIKKIKEDLSLYYEIEENKISIFLK